MSTPEPQLKTAAASAGSDGSPTFRVEVKSWWDDETWQPLKNDFASAEDAAWIASYYRLIKERDARVLVVKSENAPDDRQPKSL